jgi:hypothetical protein
MVLYLDPIFLFPAFLIDSVFSKLMPCLPDWAPRNGHGRAVQTSFQSRLKAKKLEKYLTSTVFVVE